MRIIFAGTPEFAASALAALLGKHQIVTVLTQPDRPAGRGMQLIASPVKQLALQHDIPVLQPSSLKAESVQQELAALSADVMVVAAYGLILPQAVLQIPRYGCLNIHASLLPRWRGAAPIQRAIQAGDTETGITIMQMDEGLDTGDMLLRRVCPIAANETAQSLHDQLAVIGAASIVEALELLPQGKLATQRQDGELACYAAKLLKPEAQMDWGLSAQQLQRTIRAFNPFPVCHTRLGELTIKLWQAELADGTGEPGTVLALDKRGITVACGQSALLLTVLQRPSGKAQPAAQFLQAVPINIGDRLC
jgi:methionyl-tRNA formyltransferase